MMLAKSAWNIAFSAAVDFSRRPRKAELITERWNKYSAEDRKRAFRLFYAWLRGQGLAREVLKSLMQRVPRKNLQLLLELACSELLVTEEERHPAIVSSAVDYAKASFSHREAGLCNAVLRKASGLLAKTSLKASHPSWLVHRWTDAFGEEETDSLLRWNQSIPKVYLRWNPRAAPPLPSLLATPWPHFYTFSDELRSQAIQAVEAGSAYIQDPFTRHPVAMALKKRPQTILDLCAAPGGKTRALIDAVEDLSQTTIVASDLAGPRLEQLKENLSSIEVSARPHVVGADGTQLTAELFAAQDLPTAYEAIILDVPCSNTGVIQRRPDVRWLLQPEALKDLLWLQARLMDAAAALVQPGGRLVYSTCSLEPDENEEQVQAFMQRHPAFCLTDQAMSRPWIDGHDGGAAFTLTREV